MTAPTATNVAQGHAHVGIQAQAIHGNAYYYQLPPDASAEEKFRSGVKYLDARMLSTAQTLIEEAVAEGYRTNEVHFHRLLALLSGRTLRQLASEDFDRLNAICQDVAEHRRHDEWSGGLRAVLRLLDCLHTGEIEQTVKEIDELAPDQRRKIVDHLGLLLEGPMVDQMWRRSVEQARVGRTANQRGGTDLEILPPQPRATAGPSSRADVGTTGGLAPRRARSGGLRARGVQDRRTAGRPRWPVSDPRLRRMRGWPRLIRDRWR
ncbi:hypothetical protein [Micromonospora fulviviridis]|uniref:DUF4158 domain-containing protein n=1 Tax=Micromonospora fulviviridis TaxID=47860 RepID=A0ABV2VCB5_9ACTN